MVMHIVNVVMGGMRPSLEEVGKNYMYDKKKRSSNTANDPDVS